MLEIFWEIPFKSSRKLPALNNGSVTKLIANNYKKRLQSIPSLKRNKFIIDIMITGNGVGIIPIHLEQSTHILY